MKWTYNYHLKHVILNQVINKIRHSDFIKIKIAWNLRQGLKAFSVWECWTACLFPDSLNSMGISF